VLFDVGADDLGGGFEEGAVGFGEGGWVVTVDVDFADDAVVGVDGDDDLGFGFDGAGEIAGVGVDVVYDDGLAGGHGSSADALGDGDADVWGWVACVGAEDEGFGVGWVEHVEAGPTVVRELLWCGCDDDGLEGFERGGCCGGVAEVVEEGEPGVHGSSFSLAGDCLYLCLRAASAEVGRSGTGDDDESDGNPRRGSSYGRGEGHVAEFAGAEGTWRRYYSHYSL